VTRRHVARRTRRAVGGAGAAALLGLSGGMAIAHHQAATTDSTLGTSTSLGSSTSLGTNTSQATSSTTTTTPSNGAAADDWQGSAVSGQASSQPQTSTHTS
jgi:hypothetical protein